MVKQATKTSHNEGMALGLWFRPMAEALESYGVDGSRLLSKAGINLDLLTDPWKLYPVSVRNRVWKLAVEATAAHAWPSRLFATGQQFIVNYVQQAGPLLDACHH